MYIDLPLNICTAVELDENEKSQKIRFLKSKSQKQVSFENTKFLKSTIFKIKIL